MSVLLPVFQEFQQGSVNELGELEERFATWKGNEEKEKPPASSTRLWIRPMKKKR